MRRKNRKWVAMAVVCHLFVMWSAYRWAIAQRPPNGNILDHRDRESARRKAPELAREAATQPPPNGVPRLTAGGPAFVAARCDATHVVFIGAAETESRFAASPSFGGTPAKISAPAKAAAPFAGLQELWEIDSHALHFLPEIVQQTQPGEQWTLSESPDSTIPVVIERAAIAPTGCSLAIGFLAAVPPAQQTGFAASAREYFAVRRAPVESVDPAAASHIAELPGWKDSPATTRQIEQQLNDRMKQEVARIDALHGPRNRR
ncbi:MAG: hypothetical protein WA830_11020 [Candidatus Sulfotelmatobacter sp.]